MTTRIIDFGTIAIPMDAIVKIAPGRRLFGGACTRVTWKRGWLDVRRTTVDLPYAKVMTMIGEGK